MPSGKERSKMDSSIFNMKIQDGGEKKTMAFIKQLLHECGLRRKDDINMRTVEKGKGEGVNYETTFEAVGITVKWWWKLYPRGRKMAR